MWLPLSAVPGRDEGVPSWSAAARGYVDKVRPFVARFDGPDGLEPWRVNVAEVGGLVVEVCPRLGAAPWG